MGYGGPSFGVWGHLSTNVTCRAKDSGTTFWRGLPPTLGALVVRVVFWSLRLPPSVSGQRSDLNVLVRKDVQSSALRGGEGRTTGPGKGLSREGLGRDVESH